MSIVGRDDLGAPNDVAVKIPLQEMIMNKIWSTYLQTTETLYQTRQLRFDDRFKDLYTRIFDIDNVKNILEIGAGPGALTQALSRWYPNTEVIGSDRDTEFIKFARSKAPHIKFVEADINAPLPFEDNSFDAAISHTVHEHVEPGRFYGEQYRILKPGGVCLVLSAGRKSIYASSSVTEEISDFEKEMKLKTEQYYKSADERYNVGKYGCSEQKMALQMSEYGFKNIETHYFGINLTPDSAQYEKDFAVKMIETNRRVHLDSLEYLPHIAPNVVTDEEIKKWADEINRKYDKRIELYHAGDKQWDISISFTMLLRGEK